MAVARPEVLLGIACAGKKIKVVAQGDVAKAVPDSFSC